MALEEGKFQVTTFDKGLCKSVHYSSVPQGYYTDALNIVMSNYVSNNYAANVELGTAPAIDATSIAGRTIIGYVVMETQICTFSITDSGASEIGIITDYYKTSATNVYGKYTPVISSEAGGITKVYSSSGDIAYQWVDSSRGLNFNIDKPVKAVWRRLFDSNRAIYFTDNFNKPKFLNLDSLPIPTTSNPNPSIDTAMSLLASNALPVIEVDSMLESGTLKVGVYQFLVRYLDEDGNSSLFSTATPPIPVTKGVVAAGRNQISGGVSGTVTSRAIRLKVSNIDTNFKFIELIRVGTEGATNTVIARKVDTRTIEGDTMFLTYSSTDDIDPIVSLDALVVSDIGYVTAKAIVAKDNVLTLANLSTIPSKDLQNAVNKLTLKYYVKEIPYVDIYPLPETLTAGANTTTFTENIYVLSTEKNVLYLEFSFLPTDAVIAVNDFVIGDIVFNNDASSTTTITQLMIPDAVEIVDSGRFIKLTFPIATDFTLNNWESLEQASPLSASFQALTFICMGNLVSAVPPTPIAGNPINGTYNYAPRWLTTTIDITHSAQYDFATNTLIANGGGFFAVGDVLYLTSNTNSYAGTVVITATNTVGPVTTLTLDSNTLTLSDAAVMYCLYTTSNTDELVTLPAPASSTNGFYNETYFDDYKSEILSTYDKGYRRGEAYSVGIRAIYANGSKSLPFHIPGYNRAQLYDILTPANNRTAATPDQVYASRKNASTGYLGTYISDETYPPEKGFPYNTGTGRGYSNGNKIRHNIMPSYDQEPIIRKDTVTNKLFIRILGMYPVYIDDANVEHPISTMFGTLSEFSNVVGYEMCVQSRRDIENRYVDFQCLAFPTATHIYNPSGDPDTGFAYPNLFNGHGSIASTGLRVLNMSYCKHTNSNVTGGYAQYGYAPNTVYMALSNKFKYPEIISPDLKLNPFKSIQLGSKLEVVGITKGTAYIANFAGAGGSSDALRTSDGDVVAGNCMVLYNHEYNLQNTETFVQYSQTTGLAQPDITSYSTNIIDAKKGDNFPIGNEGFTTRGARLFDTWSHVGSGGTNPVLALTDGIPYIKNYQPEFQYSPQISRDSGQHYVLETYDNITNTSNTLNPSWDPVSRNIGFKRIIYNVVIPNTTQYGNVSGAKFTVVDSKESIPLGYVGSVFFNGDTYISKTNIFQHSTYKLRYAYKSSGSLYKNDCKDVKGVEQDLLGESLISANYAWFESDYNGSFINEKVDATSGTELAGLFPKRRLIDISDILPNGLQSTKAGVFSLGFASTGVMKHIASTLNIEYNQQYLQEDLFNVSVTQPLLFTEVNKYPNRIIYSTEAVEGELADGYRRFLPVNYHDISKDKGEIEIVFTFGGVYYAHTKYSLYRSFFNDNVMTPSSEGEVYMGTGGIFSRPSVEIFPISGGYCGCSAEWGSVNTPYGRFFIDSHQGKVFMLTGESVDEAPSMVENYLNTVFSDAEIVDNPFTNNGTIAAYDYGADRVLFSKSKTADGIKTGMTVSYYPEYKNYYSFHSYLPSLMMSYGSGFYMFFNDSTSADKSLYRIQDYNALRGAINPKFANFDGVQYESFIEYASNAVILSSKAFDTVQLYGNGTFMYPNGDEKTNTERLASHIQVKTSLHDTGKVEVLRHFTSAELLTTSAADLYNSDSDKDSIRGRFINDSFNITVPRNARIDDTNPGSALDYLPEFRARVTGKHAVVKLWLDIDLLNASYNNQNISIFNIVTTFRSIAR